ncbi:hypothetical protein ACIJYG_00830 [Candidatus Pelagibacter bacterium nBUS_27]|uniref:hypothetical protein n=1 Tax=Candidatus Pelagibacter bacterium nBUS_27 TaxID=3374188 RepID=UPI003EBA19DD
MNVRKKTEKYFTYFRSKDINQLKELFDDEIILCDWESEISGLNNVVSQNIKIFKNLGKFDLKIKNIYEISKIVFAEINILTNGEVIKVIDKIEFNKDNKIIKITAYKG